MRYGKISGLPHCRVDNNQLGRRVIPEEQVLLLEEFGTEPVLVIILATIVLAVVRPRRILRDYLERELGNCDKTLSGILLGIRPAESALLPQRAVVRDATAGSECDRGLAKGLQRSQAAQQLPSNAAGQVRRITSAARYRCSSTHQRRIPLTLQPGFLRNDWYG